MVGDGLQPLIDRVFAARATPADDAAAGEYLADYEANVLVETTLFPGMTQALDDLQKDGWRLAVCTNKPERAARKLLEALGIGGRFASIGGGDSFAAHKPDPLHLRGTVEAGGGDLRRAIMVGDHTNDMRAAEGCGMPAIFAGWGYGRPGMEAGAAAIAPDAASLPGIAARLF
jgi:phosphoglycolate phosphatase